MRNGDSQDAVCDEPEANLVQVKMRATHSATYERSITISQRRAGACGQACAKSCGTRWMSGGFVMRA